MDQGVIKPDFIEKWRKKLLETAEKEFDTLDQHKATVKDTIDPAYKGSRAMTHQWAGMQFSHLGKEPESTGVQGQTLIDIGKASVQVPIGFKAHERLTRTHIGSRITAIDKNEIDWATAEAMAVGSLLTEGYNVRISGEDVERGTFSQRHMVIVD